MENSSNVKFVYSAFLQLSDLQMHMVTHVEEKPFCCDLCQYTTVEKSALKRHINCWW